MIDPDVRKDEADWNDYVNGVDRRFCPTCSYLIEAHWHSRGNDEWYACPTEADARSFWGDR